MNQKQEKNKKILKEQKSVKQNKETNAKIKVADKKSATTKAKKKKTYTKEEIDKKKAKIKKRMRWTIIVLIIAGILTFLCTSDLFLIKEIKLSGNSQVMQEEMNIDNKINSNIFLLSKRKIEEDIMENAYIKNVKVKKVLPNKLEIEVEERTKNFMIKSENGFLYLDNQGYILEEASINIAKPILVGYSTENLYPGERLNEKDLEKLEEVLKIVENCKEIEIYDKITSINIVDANEYILYIEEMKKLIYIGDATNLANKMLYIKAILKEEEGKEGKIFVNGDFSEGFQSYFREEVNQITM